MAGASKRGIRIWLTVCLVGGVLLSGAGWLGSVGLFYERVQDNAYEACNRATPDDFDGVLEAIRAEMYVFPVSGFLCAYPYASGYTKIDDHLNVGAFGVSAVGLTALIISLVGLPMTLVRRPPVGVTRR